MSEKEKSIGALWQKSGKKGNWFSGSIEINGEKIQIVVFGNGYKKEDKHPDYKIFLKREGEGKPTTETNSENQDEEEVPF